MSASTGEVRSDQVGGARFLTISQPQKRNALNPAMWVRLLAELRAADGDHECRAVVLRGDGALAFSSGADLSAGAIQGYDSYLFDVETRLEEMSKPTIAAVQGVCYGGGLFVALACDVRICDVAASFCVPSVRYGTVPPAGSVRRLARIAGPALACDMVLSGRAIGSEEALRSGVVTACLDETRLDEYVNEYVGLITKHPRESIAEVTRLVRGRAWQT